MWSPVNVMGERKEEMAGRRIPPSGYPENEISLLVFYRPEFTSISYRCFHK